MNEQSVSNDAQRRDDLYDVIGPWSEVKLEIIAEYAHVYSTILSTRRRPSFYHLYVDAFAGAGGHISRSSGMLVPGSPRLALDTEPPFREYHFIDINRLRVNMLEELAQGRQDVFVHHGDANAVLMNQILPRVQYQDFRRALCLLDPYGLHYEWEIVEALGKEQTFDIFLNFPLMDMNMNPLRRDPEQIPPPQAQRMTAFWGDSSWRQTFYQPDQQLNMFRGVTESKSVDNERIVKAYIDRLKSIAGFPYVPEPLLMKNTGGAELYYLIFATHQRVVGDAGAVVEQIFEKYRQRGTYYG